MIQKNNYRPNFYLQHLSAYLPLHPLDHNYQQQHHVLSFSLSLYHRIIFIKSSGSTIKMLCYLMKKQFSLFIHNKSSDWAVLSLLIPHPGEKSPSSWQQRTASNFKAATGPECLGAHPCFKGVEAQAAGNSYSTMTHSNKTNEPGHENLEKNI